MLHGGTKGRNASDEICVRIVTLSRSGRPRGAQPVLTARLPAAVAIFDVIAGYDLADPVTAASQGKRANSYLRVLDKDGASAARGWAWCTSCSPPRMPIRAR